MPVKLLIAYNIKPAQEEIYYRFMMGEFLPAVQGMGLVMVEGWRTAWGNYPQRLIGLVAESYSVLEQILDREQWREMELKLGQYVTDYQRHVVPYRSGFQFLRPT
jgi:hypothetical protein